MDYILLLIVIYDLLILYIAFKPINKERQSRQSRQSLDEQFDDIDALVVAIIVGLIVTPLYLYYCYQ